MTYNKQKGFYCVVTKENQKQLSKWRFNDNDHLLDIHCYVGIDLDYGKKAHNKHTGYETNDYKYFNIQVSTSTLLKIGEIIKHYEIY